MIFFLFYFHSFRCNVWNTQLYRRCDAAVIDDIAQSNNKRVFDTAAVGNGLTKEHDRRLEKNVEKCRTKTGMYEYTYVCVSAIVLEVTSLKTQWDLMFV